VILCGGSNFAFRRHIKGLKSFGQSNKAFQKIRRNSHEPEKNCPVVYFDFVDFSFLVCSIPERWKYHQIRISGNRQSGNIKCPAAER
jgi:hypothetical protein